jgi:hypothetical protein
MPRDRSRDRVMRKLRGWDETYKTKNREWLALTERARRISRRLEISLDEARLVLAQHGGSNEYRGTARQSV